MSQALLAVKDANNTTQTLSTFQDPTNSNGLVGSTAITDPTTGNKAQVAAFHNADNQNPGGTAYGILTGGVGQLVNPNGNLDRQRETGVDGVPAVGIASGAASFAQAFKTLIAGGTSVGTQNVTPAAMSGTIGGVAWSIQVGTVMSVDSGTQAENVVVAAVTSTQFTATFAKTHSANVVIRGFVFNQERDAAGEADGATGIGTAVAAEYEFNGGGPGGGNFDRARSLQAKGKTSLTISAGGTQGSTSLTVSSNTGLKAGMQVILQTGSYPTAGTYEAVYVDYSYVEGTNTVPLLSAIQLNNTYTAAVIDAFSATGPGLNGFNATGIGIEEEALWDPVSGLFYVERAATQDACPTQNIVLEAPGLYNGATMDRARAALNAIGAESTRGGGVSNTYNVSTASVIKNSPGRVIRVSVITAGSTAGTINDCTTTGAAAATNQIGSIPNTAGTVLYLDWPTTAGLVVVPGTGQVVAVNWD